MPLETVDLDSLTEPQRLAATHLDGPMLVLAGPGSGKTRVITSRVAYLVREAGIAPWQVCAITFTNKAAAEMRRRVECFLTERQARAANLSTFHALCAKLLRQHGQRVGLTPNFSIYAMDEQQALAKQAIEQVKLPATSFQPSALLGRISSAKNELVDCHAFAAQASGFVEKNAAKVYVAYEKLLRANQAVDFDDLLVFAVRLLSEHQDIRGQVQDRWAYLLIDEYQDTNIAQFRLAELIAGPRGNLVVVGDPDQSIYRWRGADIRNILDFESHFPNARVVRLEQNFRSTQHILTAADRLIGHNTGRKPKKLFSDLGDGQQVRIVRYLDGSAEAQQVARWLMDLHVTHGVPYAQMAVFYRVNALSRELETAFRNAAIPYQIARGTAFFERKEIRDALAYLRMLVNPDDSLALERIVNLPPRGIGAQSLKAVEAWRIQHGLSLFQAMKQAEHITGLKARAIASLKAFTDQVDRWRHDLDAPPDDSLIGGQSEYRLRAFVERLIRQSGLEKFYKGKEQEPDEERALNLGELVSFTQQFEQELLRTMDEPPTLRARLEALMERVALVSDADGLESESGMVSLMTMHTAKGLEFDAVAVIAAEDGLLPHQRASQELEELEEERRLLFVAMTRARKWLQVSHTQLRMVFGNMQSAIPSRFLREIKGAGVREKRDDTPAEFQGGRGDVESVTGSAFAPGVEVNHPMFGRGRIIQASGGRLTVRFETFGIKTLMRDIAPLSRV
ncbi:MAG: UvrD-helicase domain-containing protein [Phycisphaeraceae bacterium]|nr:UvrD-helicase domain-containing protein [Phycisphaeraceae bacterium]